jgi:hypothetical protein
VRSYQNEKDLFNFDYKKDLRNHVVSRDRVFGTRKLGAIQNESDDEDELAIKDKLYQLEVAAPEEVDQAKPKVTPS